VKVSKEMVTHRAEGKVTVFGSEERKRQRKERIERRATYTEISTLDVHFQMVPPEVHTGFRPKIFLVGTVGRTAGAGVAEALQDAIL